MALRVSPCAALALGLLVFFRGGWGLALLLPPVLVHEAGHWLMLCLCRCRVRGLVISLRGLRMDYTGTLSRRQMAAVCLAGPAAGVVYALLAAYGGRLLHWDALLVTSGVSLLLSLFNMLPALPLDGGRLLECLCAAPRPRRLCTRITALALLGVGLVLATRGMGPGLILPGAFLLLQPADTRLPLAFSGEMR